MSDQRKSWTDLLHHEGRDFLTYIKQQGTLRIKFGVLSAALYKHLCKEVCTQENAHHVWKAIPAVLGCCNEQGAYEKPGFVWAYAWLHLLDRYVRTWIALKRLVEESCIPMGRYGVSALDVGTGPGPSAFAIHDFYTAMVEFSEKTGNLKWQQPAHVTCIELDSRSNHLRHLLAEIVFEQSQRKSKGVLKMCGALADFGEIKPTQERRQLLQTLRNAEDEYFDEEANQWTSELSYSQEEANLMAQSLHRYRLIMFSNFLTTFDKVNCFKPNLEDILQDAAPGSVLLVLGGKKKEYPRVYEYVDQLASDAKFQLKVAGKLVSCSKSEIVRVHEEGQRFYKHLQELDPNEDYDTLEVRKHFEGTPESAPSSQLWAYRKY